MATTSFHRVYRAGILLKGINAALEGMSGILLYLIPTGWITSVVLHLTQNDLIDDPRDLIARPLHDWALQFSASSQGFFALYLAAHGLVKLVLMISLLRGKMWAYPVSLVVMVGFVVYQLYRFSFTHAPGLLVLTAFDVIVLLLIWREYRRVRQPFGLPSR